MPRGRMEKYCRVMEGELECLGVLVYLCIRESALAKKNINLGCNHDFFLAAAED